MYHIKFVKHADMTQLDLLQVVNLKKKQWNYTVDEHLKWIAKNLRASDIHVFLILENKNVAYLNLIDINIVIDNKVNVGWGVGNVCAIERGRGFGYELMSEANKYILQSKKIGFLFCRVKLLNFYEKLGWISLTQHHYMKVSNELKAMVLNLELKKNTHIEYNGQPF